MKRLIFVLFASAMAAPLAAQPAAPSPDAAMECALQGMSAEQRALVASGGSQELMDVPAERAAEARAALDAVQANVRRCTQASGMTENQRQLALYYTLMRLTREDMLRRYDAQNVDLRFIDEAVAATPAGSPPPFEQLVARVRAQGVGDDRPDSAGDIVYLYMVTVMQAAEIRTRFGDPNFTIR